MSRSREPLDQVLVYDCLNDQAFWMTPAKASRIRAANPYFEQIDEVAPNYQAVLRLAGPKPEIYPPPLPEGPRENE